jgi:hypothetical protein
MFECVIPGTVFLAAAHVEFWVAKAATRGPTTFRSFRPESSKEASLFLTRPTTQSLLLAAIVAASLRPAQAGVGFQPVSPEELKMTREPQAPGAPAVILYREVFRDDYGRTARGGLTSATEPAHADRHEDNYFRIKILTEAGRRYGNVEIALSSSTEEIALIEARTIEPDGSVVNFHGKVLDKAVTRSRGSEYAVKTIVLPDVQVGSIIEYFYTIVFKEGWVYSSQWLLSHELFTKKAKFTLRPYGSDYAPLSMQWSEKLPPGSPEPTKDADGLVRMEIANVPAFHAEDFMPPQGELQARVNFIYSYQHFETDPAKFWKKVGKKRNDELEHFVGKQNAMQVIVAESVAPADPPEMKLRKIYARVQRLGNTSYQISPRTVGQMPNEALGQVASLWSHEKRHDKDYSAETAEQIWKDQGGDAGQLSWLYLALVRAAGIEAYGVLVPDRSNSFFSSQSMDAERLNGHVVVVKLDGKDVFLNPGAAFNPFGSLPWEETAVQGLKLDGSGGTWVQTPLPDSSASYIVRRADFKLSESGGLEGKVTLTFAGQECSRRRTEKRNQDDAAHKRYLEEQLKASIPAGTEVELTKQPDWINSDAPFSAEFSVKIPGWATVNGPGRVILPVGIFTASEKHIFDYSERVHPIYFEYLAQTLDDITIELPANWRIASVPRAQNQDLHVVAYATSAENRSGALHLTRKLDINILTMENKYYGPLRSFFEIVRTGDDQPVILAPGTATSSNQ